MYKNILIPVSPDAPANASPALDFARSILAEGGTLTTITALEVPPAYAAEYLTEEQAEKMNRTQEQRMRDGLSKFEGVKTRIVTGHPAQAILDEANAINADCIVISAQQPGPVSFLLGSVAARVVRRAGCSVHVLR